MYFFISLRVKMKDVKMKDARQTRRGFLETERALGSTICNNNDENNPSDDDRYVV